MRPPVDSSSAESDPASWTHSAFFREHAPRLEALIRGKLASRFQPRFDAEDVVQSAFRSFFLRPAPRSPTNSKETDLWPLLAEIGVRKLAQQVRRHQAQRRDVRADCIADEKVSDSGSNPLEAASLTEIIDQIQTALDIPSREAFRLRLQGYEILEIADQLQTSERTVRRQITGAKKLLARLLELEPDTAASSHSNSADHSIFATLQFSDYRLHQWIGDGAAGNVYRATEKVTGRPVAVKFLKKQFLYQPRWVDTFLREVNIVSRLQHPGIISIFGLGRTPNRGFFLVMEWAPAGDLARLTLNKRTSLPQIYQWLVELTAALQHAHQHGIIHCDLKPGNVLIGAHGQLLLGDFGLARGSLNLSDLHYNEGGTPAYIAPELLDEKWGPVGPATDVFGVGAILFNLLTGHPPHGGKTLDDVLQRAVNGTSITWPSLPNQQIPLKWQKFCDRLLAKNVADRWPDMSAVHRELLRLNSPSDTVEQKL